MSRITGPKIFLNFRTCHRSLRGSLKVQNQSQISEKGPQNPIFHVCGVYRLVSVFEPSGSHEMGKYLPSISIPCFKSPGILARSTQHSLPKALAESCQDPACCCTAVQGGYVRVTIGLPSLRHAWMKMVDLPCSGSWNLMRSSSARSWASNEHFSHPSGILRMSRSPLIVMTVVRLAQKVLLCDLTDLHRLLARSFYLITVGGAFFGNFWRSQSCSANLQRIFENFLDVTAKSPHFRNPKFESCGHRSQPGRSDLNTTVPYANWPFTCSQPSENILHFHHWLVSLIMGRITVSQIRTFLLPRLCSFRKSGRALCES